MKPTYNNVDTPSESHCYKQLLLYVYYVTVLRIPTVTWSLHCYNRYIVVSGIVISGLDCMSSWKASINLRPTASTTFTAVAIYRNNVFVSLSLHFTIGHLYVSA